MAALPPSDSKPAGDERNLVAVDATPAATFEDKLNAFWAKYRTLISIVCVAIVVAILAKGGWEYMARQKEADVEKSYAAATTPEQLKAFISAHGNHSLAGIAQLRLADEAYGAGKSADAVAGYDKAASILKTGPLGARAKLGRALAKVQSGNAADGTKELKALADDANELKAIRTEAAYHLTSLSVDAGNAAEAQKYSDQLMQIDATSPWTQRGLSLRATLPAPASAPEAPAATTPANSVQLPLPKK